MTGSAVGIDDLAAYCGLAQIKVAELATARGMPIDRMRNLMMRAKSVALPCEDVVSFAVNAARPILDRLSSEHRDAIELLVVGTESGLDLSKAVSTWVHQLLGLPRTCRLFEVKQACYAGVAALQAAVAQIAVACRQDAKALVIGVDVPRLGRYTSAEPSQGAGAVAVLVSRRPRLAVAELGAAGYYSYDITDVRRPTPVDHIWDPQLSLMSYIECLKGAFADYRSRIPGREFDRLAFHTPFPGAVKGAHRALLRSFGTYSPGDIDDDFTRRVEPSIRYPSLVGNLYAGTTLLALASSIECAPAAQETRIGIFSYGSGCSAELCSYLLQPSAGVNGAVGDVIDTRVALSVAAYDEVCDRTDCLYSGVADFAPDFTVIDKFGLAEAAGRPLIMLKDITGHERTYVEIGGLR
ncbi:hydroxymethylglutaryl-CoA synthase family protein [Streptomyces formicae]|uniref:Hydroxymethylglutaryl-CoA synthase family protein n=1 Tax=Streptomyces formicae TaxID=1616117 RepID=A0ABY3WT98_9ACTN|nr:hydroxymethylglutaryl-CoA synthase [Streptomyces formicae]UNM14786.1 hydroxymethylglutaryl-CoA synthase family protein [Streptomyces formicae]